MRIKTGSRFAGAVLAGMLTSFSGVFAAEAPVVAKAIAPLVVVVDLQVTQRDAQAARTLREQRDAFLQKTQNDFDANRKSLKDAEAELVAQRQNTPPDVWQKKARDFERRVADFNRAYQAAMQSVDRAYRAAMIELSKTMLQVTEEVANETGATLVLPKSQVVMHDPHMDVTQIILDRVNQRLPSIAFQVQLPGAQPAPAPPSPPKKK